MKRKITEIQMQKKSSRRNIFLDGQFFCGVDYELVVKFGLRVGLEIDEERLKKLVEEEEIHKAKNYVFDLLMRRSYTQKEMIDKLKRKEFSERAISATIETLKRLGYIKDESYAEDWVESRKRLKPKGRKALREELTKKGIDKGIIDRVVAGIDDEEEREMALRAAQKQAVHYKGLDQKVAKRRLYGFLLRRGFEYRTIGGVVKEVLGDLDEDERF